MSDLVAAIDLEISELEEALRGDPRHQKLAKLRELRALYSGTPSSADVSQAAAAKPGRRLMLIKRKIDPERKRILDEIEQILNMLGPDPIKTADIYDMLIAGGFVIGGNDPRNYLSAMIHNSGRFQSHGRRGWSLKAAPSETQVEEEVV